MNHLKICLLGLSSQIAVADLPENSSEDLILASSGLSSSISCSSDDAQPAQQWHLPPGVIIVCNHGAFENQINEVNLSKGFVKLVD